MELPEDFPDELAELLRITTAHRDAGRIEEADRGYEQLAASLGAREHELSQMQAAGAEVWRARFALEAGDAVRGRELLIAARARSMAAGERWGVDHAKASLQIECAGELAGLALDAGDEDVALAELKEALRVAAQVGATSPAPDSLDAAALAFAGIAFGSEMPGTGARVLDALAEHVAEEPLRAAKVRGALANQLGHAGDDAAALDEYRRAATALGDAQGPEADRLRGTVLNNAGFVADRLGEYALAGVLYDQALEAHRRVLPEDDLELLTTRYNAAELLRVTNGDLELAASELRAVADLDRSRAGGPSPMLPRTLKNLAQAQLALRQFAEAERTCEQALALDPEPEMRVQLLVVRADARERQDRPADVSEEMAEAAADVAETSGERSVDHAFAMIAVARTLPPERSDEAEAIEVQVAEHLAGAHDHRSSLLRSQVLAALAARRWEGGDLEGALRVFAEAVPAVHELRAEMWRVRSVLENDASEAWPVTPPLVRMVATEMRDHEEARRLAFRATLAAKRLQAEAFASWGDLVLEGRSDLLDVQQLATQLRRAVAWGKGDAEDVEALATVERAMAREVPREALVRIAERSTAEAVAEALPPHSVLVEYAMFPPFSRIRAPARYDVETPWCVAFVLPARHPEELTIVDLGDAGAIAAAVEALREAIPPGRPAPEAWRERSRSLADLVWAPVEKHLPPGRDVFVAPDGALCGAPFDALPDADGRPLLESRTLTLLATGRDATRLVGRANWQTTSPVVFANPDFGEPWEPFGPLLGTVEEGSRVAAALGVEPVTDEQATRDALLGVVDPEILHLATHGYYAGDGDGGGVATHLSGPIAGSPLMRSGVAVAGANDASRVGVVTALDVLGMQMTGTDLVVLSSCQSGLGDLSEAEGLLGLARSFLLGGARSVVWSLWQIDDDASLRVVQDLYARLLRESGRAVALQRAKLTAYRERPERVDVWAGMALQGDPAPLMRYRLEIVSTAQIPTRPAREQDGAHVLDTGGRPAALFEVPAGDGESLRVLSLGVENLWQATVRDALEAGFESLRAAARDEAQEHFARARELLAEERPGGRLLSAELHDGLAVVSGMSGDFAGMRDHATRAVEIREDLGGHDAAMAATMDNLGMAEFNLGDHEGGIARVEAALALKRAVLPAGHEQIAFSTERIAEMRGMIDP